MNHIPPSLTWDSTDHFAFVCPDCGCDLHIRKTEDILVQGERCIRFYLKCPVCSRDYYRKIYGGKPGVMACSLNTQMPPYTPEPKFNPETDMPGQ